jgi:hypothetical protein
MIPNVQNITIFIYIPDDINSTEVKPRLGTYIPIFAEVTETITGNKANGSGNARIYTYVFFIVGSK